MSNHDAIIIGGGHNGLTCAASLARGGRKVLVLERDTWVGGLAASEEFAPGYKTAGVLHDTSRVHPAVVANLKLERYGMKLREEETTVLSAEVGGPGLLLHRDPNKALELSPADAEGYAAMQAFVDHVRGFTGKLLDKPPPDIRATGLSGARPLLKIAWALRRLGKRTMLDLLRIGPMCASDWLAEYVEDDRLRALIAAPGLSATWAGPRSAGTAALVLMHECTRGPDVEGGGPALVQALRAACESDGVDILTGAGVRRIVASNGAVTGVELDTGDVIEAPVVASSLDPRQTFFDLIDPTELPVGFGRELRSWRCRGTTAVLRLALDGPLEIEGRPGQTFESIVVGQGLAEFERAFDAVKYGEMSEAPVLDVRVPTSSNPTLAPKGHHVVSILAHFFPRDLRGGWTDAARQQVEEVCLRRLASVAPSVRDRIVALEVLTPADLEQRYAITGGHLHHGEHALDQLFWLRPSSLCAQYATPLDGLYLCGSGSHPGGGLTCAPGALAAAEILR